MRMEELANNKYIKKTDTVEKYLLELVRSYFKGGNVADDASREATVNKAVERMKEELTLDGMGVTSIIINGETKTGAVTITLEDLGGEPWINPKRSAFNVDFGTTKGTACEGNDPRLSDDRHPLAHKHKTSDIIGLDGILSTITGKVDRVNGLAHSHSNKDVLDKLVYTGNKTIIDLGILDNLEDKISNIVNQIRSEITNFKNDIAKLVTATEKQINDIEKKIDALSDLIEKKNKEYYAQAVSYTDTKYAGLKKDFEDAVKNFVVKNDLKNVLDAANQIMSKIDTFGISVRNILDFTGYQQVRKGTYAIPASVKKEMVDRGVNIMQCQTEFLISYVNENSRRVYAPIPYITFENGDVDGNLQVSNDADNIYITYTSKAGTYIPDEVQNATIICNFYSRQDVTL